MKIDNIELIEIQKKLFEILVEFDRICRKNNLKYTLEGGTLLGAVKYKGFVPWDDDIDVVMLREDYDKFCEIAKCEISEKYFLSNNDTCAHFPLSYSKLCAEGTLYVQRGYEHLDMHQGVFIDIFPIDNINKKYFKLQKILISSLQGGKSVKLKVGGPKKIRYLLFSILPLRFINKNLTKLMNLFNKKNTRYVYELCARNDNFPPLERRIYTELIELEFCEKKFLCSQHYQEFLKSRFGNIEEIPPAEKRKPSHNIIKVKI